ncbi:MAG: hypothetical protein VYA80_06705 [Pseudomonadota bacterium]|nr:hypothetical protein [Pseudomonadota bacterium]
MNLKVNKPQIGSIRISGDDSLNFLQGQLTQDLGGLSENSPLMSGWANSKGRLLCVTFLISWKKSIWMILPESIQESVANRLKMYVLRSKVKIDIANSNITISNKEPEFSSSKYCFEKENKIFFRTKIGTGLCLDLNHQQTLEENKSLDDWRLANIEAGIPSVWPTTTETFVPQMLNLDLLGAISFEKGCYVGQEIVARTQNLGRIKRRMYRFICSTSQDAYPGDKIYLDGKESGEIVDAIRVPATKNIELLAVIPINQSKEKFHLDSSGETELKNGNLPYEVPSAV